MRFLPGSTIGMLGGGQLGRMSLLAGRRMGYRFVVLDPQPDCAAAPVADECVSAPFDDVDAARRLAGMVDVVTLEFENIPARTVAAIEDVCPVRPGRQVLHVCQNRQREKAFLRDSGFPCAPFAVVESSDQLRSAVAEIGVPAVIKTADFGYDGKGQRKITADTDLAAAWDEFDGRTAVVEKWIHFEGEYSVICARNAAGDVRSFPVSANGHRNHILHQSTVPCGLSDALCDEARQLGEAIATKLDVVGLLAVELFLCNGRWLVNELAPRPHNSGHYSFDACLTSQFEQHIRAVAGIPLGDPGFLRPVSMVNLLGDLWTDGKAPDWNVILRHPRAKLHLYGKGAARAGRKMGHFCVFADDPREAESEAEQLFQRLRAEG